MEGRQKVLTICSHPEVRMATENTNRSLETIG